MPDPKIDAFSEVEFRNRAKIAAPRRSGPDRFWVGVSIFLLVAMAYPFYSYAVHSYLVDRELRVAAALAGAEMERFNANLRREAAESQRVAAAEALRTRQRRVSVAGTSTIGGKRIVIVNLGQASLVEAKATVCAQAERYFREPLAGEALHIQRHRGKQPAIDAGTIICD